MLFLPNNDTKQKSMELYHTRQEWTCNKLLMGKKLVFPNVLRANVAINCIQGNALVYKYSDRP